MGTGKGGGGPGGGGGGGGGGQKVGIISNFHATFAIYMGRALTYMCWISSGGV